MAQTKQDQSSVQTYEVLREEHINGADRAKGALIKLHPRQAVFYLTNETIALAKPKNGGKS